MSETFNQDPIGAQGAELDASGNFLVVGLGASAGGIQALKEFFARVPAESSMAYVVILHLSPDHDSQLAEVLQSASAIPVTQVENHIRVEPNHVYVIPPNKSLMMNDGHLDISNMTSTEVRRAPVDIFFRTLAESHRARAVSVVLSGTGANGSMGMKRVKEMGGLCIVQDPSEAEYDDMPRHSLATGLVDYALPVSEIPAQIIAYREQLKLLHLPESPPAPAEADANALRDIFTQLRVRTGHDFSNYKRATVLRRIARRMGVNELQNLPAYSQFMHERPAEANALLKDLLISVTNFFRDAESFEKLEQEIIPKLFKDKTADDQVRVWVAGCATGEEAYTLTMMLADYAANLSGPPQIQVFATDIDEDAIATARDGFYTLNDAADVPPERLNRYFVEADEGYRVRREIRERVLFAIHNVIKDPPFGHLDLATCRNLLIYLNQTAQRRVMDVLHFALNPGGYLMLGASESIDGASDLFTVVDKEHRLYQGRAIETRLIFPVPDGSLIARLGKLPEINRARESQSPHRSTYAELHQRLLERYAPPSVVINEDYDILHMSESAGRYMELKGGEPSTNLLMLIRPELRLELRSALYQAMQKKTDVGSRGISIKVGDETKMIDVHVRPVLSDVGKARGFLLVLFEEANEAMAAAAAAQEGARVVDADEELLSRRLEEELLEVKAQLSATVEQHEIQREELKATNEELQAMNEEMRAAGEELETSKEELQSINEELTTVNQELKIKIEELGHSNDDFKNLMNSTQIGTVFLDRNLRIKLFTPRARDIFNLIPADVGRRLSDITSKLDGDPLIADAEKVLERLQPIERAVRTKDGHTFLMQVVPYRTAEDRINGVVVSFMDISERQRAEEATRRSEEQFRRAIEDAPIPVIMHAEDGEVLQISRTWTELTGYTLEDVQPFDAWFTRAYGEGAEAVRAHMYELFKGNRRALNIEFPIRTSRGEMRHWSFSASSPGTLHDGRRYIIGMAVDITESKQTQEALRESKERVSLMMESAEANVRERTFELAKANESLRDEISERIRTEKARVRLLRQIVRAQEDERRRIARDIHDHLGQQMTALRLNLEALDKGGGEDEELRRKLVEQTKTIAAQLDADVDFLAWELRPAALDDIGLAEALGNYLREWSKHSGIEAQFHTTGMDAERLAPETETNLYRITQEALNNIMKYSRATRADVLLERRDHQVVLIIEDNGVGFNPQKAASVDAAKGMGIIGMRERAALVGGTLEIESKPKEGTTIFARVPVKFLEEEAEEAK